MKDLKPNYNGRPIHIEPTGYADEYPSEAYQARVHLSAGPEGCRFAYGADADAALQALEARLAQERADLNAELIEKEGVSLREPMHTVTSRDRFGLVTVEGVEYAIADIGLRMLQPRELFRAQGFPESYVIGDDGRYGLKLTKTAQVRMVGNSVCPPLAAALVRANVSEMAITDREAVAV